MKKIILCLAFLLGAITVDAQNILIVDNTTTSPIGDNYYTNLQEAIDAASSGDVIHLLRSSKSYGTANIYDVDNLAIIGVGMNPRFMGEETKYKSEIDSVNLFNSSSIRLSGLDIYYFNSNFPEDIQSTNLIIEHSILQKTFLGDISDVLIRGSFFNHKNGANSIYIYSSAQNVTVANSIIEAQLNYGWNTTFLNNLFRTIQQKEYHISECNSCTLKNNIFIGSEQLGQFSSFLEGSLISHNYFDYEGYGYINSTSFNIVSVDNIPSGSIANIFTNELINSPGQWLLEWEIELEAIGLKNVGSDGTDIGPTGGLYPYQFDRSPLPYIYSADVPVDVKEGEDIEVTINAKGN